MWHTACQVFSYFFPVCIILNSTVFIGSIWKRRRYLPKLIVLIGGYQIMQIGKKKEKTWHAVQYVPFFLGISIGFQFWHPRFWFAKNCLVIISFNSLLKSMKVTSNVIKSEVSKCYLFWTAVKMRRTVGYDANFRIK
jgi:hypothetical protein